jgi:hypothetical protein
MAMLVWHACLLQQKHSLDKLFEGLLLGVLREKPSDPLQFIIDTLSLGPEHAAQASDAVMQQLSIWQHSSV